MGTSESTVSHIAGASSTGATSSVVQVLTVVVGVGVGLGASVAVRVLVGSSIGVTVAGALAVCVGSSVAVRVAVPAGDCVGVFACGNDSEFPHPPRAGTNESPPRASNDNFLFIISPLRRGVRQTAGAE